MRFKEIKKKNVHDAWPHARSGHCMCCDRNFLYVFGGYHPENDHTVYNELWRFNTSTQKWCKLPDTENKAPRCCLSSSMLLWKHSLVVFGGTSYPFGQSNSANISIYSLKTLQWYVNVDRIANDNRMINDDGTSNRVMFEKCGCYTETDMAPDACYGQSMVINPLTDVLYIFGGTLGFVYNAELYAFCLRNKYWMHYQFCELHDSAKPSSRYRHEAINGSGGFFVLGGDFNALQYGFEQIEHFSFNEKQWSKKQCSQSKSSETDENVTENGFPFERVSHSCCSHDNLVYLIGGTNSELRHMTSQRSNIWALDLKDMSWSVKVIIHFLIFNVYIL